MQMPDPGTVAQVLGAGAAGLDTQFSLIVRSPSSGDAGTRLLPMDLIESIAGVPASDVEAMIAALVTTRPGDPVDVTVFRDDKRLTVRAPTYATAAGETALAAQVDIEGTYVLYAAGMTGIGWSATLMFALSLYDRLTDGALTGGRTIGGAGMLDLRGGVGPVQGIPHGLVSATPGLSSS